jgi:hypothetical protein
VIHRQATNVTIVQQRKIFPAKKEIHTRAYVLGISN